VSKVVRRRSLGANASIAVKEPVKKARSPDTQRGCDISKARYITDTDSVLCASEDCYSVEHTKHQHSTLTV